MLTQDCSALFAEPDVARAAIDAARAVFAPVINATAVDAPAPRAMAMWSAAESVLAAVTQRADLNGQALVREASRLQRLSLEGAHALIALHGWQEQTQESTHVESTVVGAPSDTERRLATDALQTLEFAVADHARQPSLRRENALSTKAPPVLAPSAAAPPAAPGSPKNSCSICSPVKCKKFDRTSVLLSYNDMPR